MKIYVSEGSSWHYVASSGEESVGEQEDSNYYAASNTKIKVGCYLDQTQMMMCVVEFVAISTIYISQST